MSPNLADASSTFLTTMSNNISNYSEPRLPDYPLRQEVHEFGMICGFFVILMASLTIIPLCVWTVNHIRIICKNIRVQATADVEQCCVLSREI